MLTMKLVKLLLTFCTFSVRKIHCELWPNLSFAELMATVGPIDEISGFDNVLRYQESFLRIEYQKYLLEQSTASSEQGKATTEGVTSQVAFKFYNKASPNTSIELEPSLPSIAASPFDINKETRFMTHGFWSSGESDTSQNVKNAYLKYQDVNMILVDWRKPASTINYISAAKNTLPIGQYTAELIDVLVEYGADPEQIHLIGHSLGAHISGFAGKYCKYNVSRITGLDPAGPLFETFPIMNDHLSVGDAHYVDIIHTSAGSLGYKSAIGNIDFFPNDGKAPQPGCKGITYLLGGIATMFDSCSHGRSWVYFADSINPQEKFKSEKCPSLGKCDGGYEMMGEYVQQNGSGSYYLKTNSQPLYAMD